MSNKKRRILMLGGAYSQMPAIEYAKSAGYHVITCDYLPDNPGHRISDEYYNVSTTEKEQVLALAKKLDIDGILAYASEPAALTAAFVSDELNLPGPSYASVLVLSRKDHFRSFLKKNKFNCLRYCIMNSVEERAAIEGMVFPLVVKPVDSSGSKGVSIVPSVDLLQEAVEAAFSYTRCQRIIIEEYIDTPYHQLHGDGFVLDGELVFLGICDQWFKGMAPIGSSYPSSISDKIQAQVKFEIQQLLKKVGYNCGAINVEVRIGQHNEIYILEIGPRSGGNYVPQLMKCGTGFNELKAIIDLAMGEDIVIDRTFEKRHCLQYIAGTTEIGSFENIALDRGLRKRIVEEYRHKEKGEKVKAYTCSVDVVGVLIARYEEGENIEQLYEQFSRCVQVRDEIESSQ